MHIHIPRPIHGWKQFLNEVAVISVGIGIALTGEQLLEARHERHMADKSFAAVREELGVNLGRMKSRLATSECVKNRLDELAAYIEAPVTPRRPAWVGRPQVWSMQTGAFDAARAYGSMTVLPRDVQMKLSTIYASMAGFAEVQEEEQWAWAELRSIAEDRDLTDNDRASLRQAIQRARYTAWKLRVDALQAFEEAKALGIAPNAKSRGSNSVCVPMDTPFEEALRKSSVSAEFGEPR